MILKKTRISGCSLLWNVLLINHLKPGQQTSYPSLRIHPGACPWACPVLGGKITDFLIPVSRGILEIFLFNSSIQLTAGLHNFYFLLPLVSSMKGAATIVLLQILQTVHMSYCEKRSGSSPREPSYCTGEQEEVSEEASEFSKQISRNRWAILNFRRTLATFEEWKKETTKAATSPVSTTFTACHAVRTSSDHTAASFGGLY